MSGSDIDKIVDYSARLVALQVPGVKAVAATGQGFYEDPLRSPQKIEAAGGAPTAAYTHWSEVPGAPGVEWVSQDGTIEVVWKIPMRLWLPKTDADARKVALPFYDRYLRAFCLDHQLSGLVLRAEISRFEIGGDRDWSWLDVGLTAVERINYAQ